MRGCSLRWFGCESKWSDVSGHVGFRWQCPCLDLSCDTVQPSSISFCPSPFSSSRTRICRWVRRVGWCHPALRLKSWPAAGRWEFNVLVHWTLTEFRLMLFNWCVYTSVSQHSQMDMKGFQFSDKHSHSPGIPSGSYRWARFACRHHVLCFF